MDLATFTNAYLAAFQQMECGEDGQPSALSRTDIATATRDAHKFHALADALADALGGQAQAILSKNATQAGYDFYLTRNGHGAGFWDRPEIYGETLAQMLTAAAIFAGECYAEGE